MYAKEFRLAIQAMAQQLKLPFFCLASEFIFIQFTTSSEKRRLFGHEDLKISEESRILSENSPAFSERRRVDNFDLSCFYETS